MIRPKWSLSELFGDDFVYNAAPSSLFPGYRARLGQPLLDRASGAHLIVAGTLPSICSAAVANDRCLSFLRGVGLDVPESIFTYDSEDSYRSLLKGMEREGGSVAFQYAHDPNEVDPDLYWVNRALLVALNDKGRMSDWVPEGYLPSRRVLPSAELESIHGETGSLPIVVKVSTDEPAGGGSGVHLCRTLDDVEAARELFGRSDAVVIEEFLSPRLNLCVQFSTIRERGIAYLGTSEQICDPNGRYEGNWLDRGTETPQEAIDVGWEIMRRAVESGYRGLAGFDMMVLDDGRIRVLDLNFRINGSTAALLLLESVEKELSKPVMRLGGWCVDGGYDQVADATRRAFGQRLLLPFVFYEAEEPGGDRKYNLSAALLCATREEVARNEASLATLGIHPALQSRLATPS